MSLGMLFLLVPAISAAQARDTVRAAALAGVVRDSLGQALGDVWVSLSGKPLSTFTDAEGRFQLRGAPGGRAQFTFRRLGYSVVTLDTTLVVDSTVSVDVRMSGVQVLPDVDVRAESWSPRLARDGFYDRQKAGWGNYLLPDDIAKMNVSYPSAFLRDVPFVFLDCSPLARRTTGGCIVLGAQKVCMSLFVDGVYQRMHLDQRVSPGMVYAVEIYHRPALVPMEFQRPVNEGRCGAVAVWTQSRKP